MFKPRREHYLFYISKKCTVKWYTPGRDTAPNIHRLIPSEWEKYDPRFHKHNFMVGLKSAIKLKYNLSEWLEKRTNDRDKTVAALAKRLLKRVTGKED